MNVQDIDINKIKVLENIRTRIETVDLSLLMESIKQHGLFHPIGVWKENDEFILSWGSRRLMAYKKLGYKKIPGNILPEKLSEEDFIIQNTCENIHRLDISPIELGRNCHRLKEMGLSDSELAARLSIPKSRIDNALHLYHKLPKKYESLVGYINGRVSKKGKISAYAASKILNFRISKKEIEELLDYAKREELSIQELTLVDSFLRTGSSLETALKNLKKYKTCNIKFAVNKKESEKIEGDFVMYLFEIIEGIRKPHPGLIFFKKSKK